MPALEMLHLLDLDRGIVRPVDHAISDGQADVDPGQRRRVAVQILHAESPCIRRSAPDYAGALRGRQRRSLRSFLRRALLLPQRESCSMLVRASAAKRPFGVWER